MVNLKDNSGATPNSITPSKSTVDSTDIKIANVDKVTNTQHRANTRDDNKVNYSRGKSIKTQSKITSKNKQADTEINASKVFESFNMQNLSNDSYIVNGEVSKKVVGVLIDDNDEVHSDNATIYDNGDLFKTIKLFDIKQGKTVPVPSPQKTKKLLVVSTYSEEFEEISNYLFTLDTFAKQNPEVEVNLLLDKTEETALFIKNNELSYPIYLASNKIISQLDIDWLPVTFFLDDNNRLEKTSNIPLTFKQLKELTIFKDK